MTSKHNARLMREAIGNQDGEMPIDHGNLFSALMTAAIVLTALALATMNEDPPTVAAAYVDDAAGVFALQQLSPPQPVKPTAAATPESVPPAAASTPAKEPEGNVVDMTY